MTGVTWTVRPSRWSAVRPRVEAIRPLATSRSAQFQAVAGQVDHGVDAVGARAATAAGTSAV